MSLRLPQLNARELIALPERAGFVRQYQDSSHLYLRDRHGLTTSVPIHPGDVKRGLVHKILFRDCRLTRSQVLKLLKK